MRRKALVLVACLTVAVAVAAEEVSSTSMLANSCFACHGVDGEGAGKVPELKGLDKEDISESLLGFKSGDERSTIMGHIAKGLTNEEIEALAEYFAALKE